MIWESFYLIRNSKNEYSFWNLNKHIKLRRKAWFWFFRIFASKISQQFLVMILSVIRHAFVKRWLILVDYLSLRWGNSLQGTLHFRDTKNENLIYHCNMKCTRNVLFHKHLMRECWRFSIFWPSVLFIHIKNMLVLYGVIAWQPENTP